MENMDMGLTVPKWVLIVWPKIPQMPKPNLSTQFVCPSPKVLDFNGLHWASVVRGPVQAVVMLVQFCKWPSGILSFSCVHPRALLF